MNWMKDHVYIASWLSAFTAIGVVLFKARKPSPLGKPVNWTRILLIVLALGSFPVAITPTFDGMARGLAWNLLMFTLGGIIMMRHE